MDGKASESGEATELLGSTCFSRALFGFISPVIRMARTEGNLQEEDVPEHTRNLNTKDLYDSFNNEWQKQQQKEKPSMIKALAAGRWPLLVVTGVGYILAQTLSLAGPSLLSRIVGGLSCRQLRNEQPGVDIEGCEGGELRLYLCVLSLICACRF